MRDWESSALPHVSLVSVTQPWTWELLITLPTRVHLVKGMVFPVVMYGCELDHKEGWALKNWCFWTVVLEKILESPLDFKEIKPVNPRGNQPWIFIGRTDAEAEAPIFWPPDVKSQSLEKTLMPAKMEGRRRGWQRTRWLDWHHQLKGHESGQTLGDSEGHGSLACIHGVAKSDTA